MYRPRIFTNNVLPSILSLIVLILPAIAQNAPYQDSNFIIATESGSGTVVAIADREGIRQTNQIQVDTPISQDPAQRAQTGLIINATFDSSITNHPNSLVIQSLINRAISIYQAQFNDSLTVSILFRYSNTQPNGTPIPAGNIAVGNYVIYSVPWNSFVGSLQSDARTANDITANASLPGSPLSAIMYLASSNGRALGLTTPGTMTSGGTIPGGTFDGIVTLNSDATLSFTRPVGSGYDAQKVTEHQINEILGLGSYINIFPNMRPIDVFSWSAPGTRNTTATGTRYFSINGGVRNIINFNQGPFGDFGDWLSGNCPNPDPYVQNSNACPGEYADVADWTPEEIALDIIGYDSTAPVSKAPFDFDGDRKTDISIFRPAVGEWWYLKSNNGANGAAQFGTSADLITPSDMTGDGRMDIGIFRPSSGFWYVLRSEDQTYYAFPFGTNGDLPVPADYDGDSKADAAVFRSATATWYISNSTGGTTIRQFGLTTDVPVTADYDGDGRADIAIFRRGGMNGAEWWILKSSGGTFAAQFGNASDNAVPADYTGDAKADVALWRPSTGEWFILRSQDQSYYSFPFGIPGDKPVPGDYDGDGTTDAAIFRPTGSTWYINRSTAGSLIQQFGSPGDQPVPATYVR